MSIEKINSYSCSYSLYYLPLDEEEKSIIRKLRQYGIMATGNKHVDKARLHEIEIKEAQQLNYVTNKLLTVSKMEQEKIQEKKKAKRKQNNPELDLTKEAKKLQKQKTYPTQKIGATILGEQIWLAIKIRNQK